MTPDDLRRTEAEIERLWNDGELPFMTHLAGGNEQWLCDFFAANVKPTDWVLGSHRCHFHFLLHQTTELADFCNRRRRGKASGVVTQDDSYPAISDDLVRKVKAGKSMFVFGPRFLCSAICAGTASIAAGLALSIQRRGGTERVWCFIGEGASEEGNFYESVRLVDSLNLPATFIVENNDSCCGNTLAQRRVKPFAWPACVVEYRYTMTWPHTGTGVRPTLKKR